MGKVEAYFFGFIGLFMAVIGVIYWFASGDPTGTTCIALSAGLGGLCAFYLYVTARRAGPRPEDRPEAEISEGAGDVGHFSPGSPWPIGMALSATLVLVGVIFGLWLSFIAIGGLLFSLTGLLFEHYRGNNVHTAEEIGVDPISMIGGSAH